jgi:hypothetical protein
MASCDVIAVANLTAQPKTEDIPATLKRIQAEVSGSDTDYDLRRRSERKPRLQNDALVAALTPLRKAAAGGEDEQENNGQAGPMSKADIEAIEKEWQKWRKEWIARKRNYLG